jgi:outer membrane protein OmpA-like peptidoglycan-associated protein/opacity protein-like surface antigen
MFGQSTKYGWLHQNSWSFGLGFTYPRYVSTSLRGQDFGSYGLFASIQRNFSEHVGFRFQGNYMHIADKPPMYIGNQNPDNSVTTIQNDVFLASLGLLYYFSPCEPVSPYAGFGVGEVDYKVKNSPIEVIQTSGGSRPLDKWEIDWELNAFMGAEWKIGENWKLKTEMAYHTASSGKFDGVYGTSSGGGILGGNGDTYLTYELGVLYYFGYGEKSHICEIYEGINANVDYDKIEEIVKRYQVQPSETDYSRIEDIVKRNKSVSSTTQHNNWVLIGINFDFNKATIKPESVPILYNAAEILLKNPDVKVEIQGYTDNIGSDRYNQKLSLQRAETVKNFLIAKGISANRLSTIGYGKSKTLMDNNTEQGRSLNRRIELKVIK